MPAVLTPAQVEEKSTGLVLAAVEILETSGLDKLTLRRLSDKVGVSRSTPYLYFKDKLALIDAMRIHGLLDLTQSSREAVADIKVDSDYIEYMRRLGSVYVDFGLNRPMLYRLIFVSGLADEDISHEFCQAIEQHRALVMSPMQNAYAAGMLSMPPERLDPVLWSAIHGLLTLRHAGHLGQDEDFYQVRADLENILALGFMDIDHRNKPDLS